MDKPLHELLKEQFAIKGYNIERLTRITGIPERYIEGLINGDYNKLPPAPYVRGYLLAIAPLLDLNAEGLWEEYKKEEGLKSSGASDKLPTNRFAIKSISKKKIIGAIFGILLVSYLGWNIGHLLGKPKLDIINPAPSTITTEKSTIKLVGYINPADKLLINAEEVVVDSNGLFTKDYNLQAGLNTVEFLAKRFLGKETKVVKQIMYQQDNVYQKRY